MKNHLITILLLLVIKFHQNESTELQTDPIILETDGNADFKVTFNMSYVDIDMYGQSKVSIKLEAINRNFQGSQTIKFLCKDPYVCSCNDKISTKNQSGYGEWFEITIDGIFMGRTKLFAVVELENGGSVQKISDEMEVVVKKGVDLLDTIFTISIAIVVSIIFVSFGAALDISTLKDILLKPVGPVIGFSCQFILMPILSFFIGYLLFSDNTNLWLGLFFSGVTPGGGASNMWSLILKGNVNLSIVMTTISNLAAFAMMPFWIFTLGRIIFQNGNLGVPYERITILSVSLVIPLALGLALQRYRPKLAKFLVRLLKPISIVVLIFIIVFAIITNLYIIKLFSWKVLVGGMGLPWIGYLVSYFLALLCKQNQADSLTISIETGLQNTGVAIFLLRFALEQPEADLTSVVPVSVSIMTKVPLLTLYGIQRLVFKLKERKQKKSEESRNQIPTPPEEISKY